MPDNVAQQMSQLQQSKALEAQGLYSRALDALMPANHCGDSLIAGQGLRLCLLCARWDELDGWSHRYQALLEDHVSRPGTARISPGLLNYLPGCKDLHDRLAGLFSLQLTDANTPLNVDQASPAGEPLRIGYLSADFQEHAVGFLLADMFAAHDRDRVRVFGYDLRPADSALAKSIRADLDYSRSVQHLSNTQLSKLIAQDQIQILIDLAGLSHTGRPGALAMRPAPVIMSWLGYLNTMNASFVDGIIADSVLLPTASQRRYREKVYRLPGLFTPTSALPVANVATRDQHGLPENAFIFACFNNAFKLRPEDLDLWSEILNRTPGSALWLYSAGHRDFEDGITRQAAQRGVDPKRLVFAPWLPMDQHMARMPLADLFLDTFNYNAGATAVCALSAGVPLLTRTGTTMLSRMGSSLNATLGLDALSVGNEEQFVAEAIKMASDSESVMAIRSVLVPDEELRNPLLPVQSFAPEIETLYENVWNDAVRSATDSATRQ